MNHIKNLIFDLDGTLVDTSAGIVEAVNYALKQNGQPQRSEKSICRYIGYPLKTMFADFTDHPYEPLLKQFRVKGDKVIVESAVPLEAVDDTLRVLHRHGFTMAIATTKIKSMLDGIVTKLGWQALFMTVVGGDEVSRFKPAPDIFRLALERMGADPDESLVIGDTVNDVLAAREAGIEMVGIPSPYGGLEEMVAAEPDHLLMAIDELPNLLLSHDREGLIQ